MKVILILKERMMDKIRQEKLLALVKLVKDDIKEVDEKYITYHDVQGCINFIGWSSIKIKVKVHFYLRELGMEGLQLKSAIREWLKYLQEAIKQVLPELEDEYKNRFNKFYDEKVKEIFSLKCINNRIMSTCINDTKINKLIECIKDMIIRSNEPGLYNAIEGSIDFVEWDIKIYSDRMVNKLDKILELAGIEVECREKREILAWLEDFQEALSNLFNEFATGFMNLFDEVFDDEAIKFLEKIKTI